MTNVSERIASMPESSTLAMSQKCRDMIGRGFDVINLGVGEPDFNTPINIKEAAHTAIDNNFTKYPPVAGYNELRDVIVNKLKRENNLSYNKNQIIVSCGAKHSIFNIILSVVNPGNEVIIPSPYWVSYTAISKLAGAKSIIIPTTINTKFKITPQQLDDAITNRSKIFIFNSPSNPTGSIYTYEELEGLANVLVKYPQLLILSDEIYEHINFVGKHTSLAQIDKIKEQVIVVNGVSKGFAMTGWRLGYFAGPKWLVDACNKLQGQMTSGVSTISQKAAIEALSGNIDSTKKMCDSFEKRRDLIVSLSENIPGFKVNKPDGAFYIFPDVSQLFGTKHGSFEIHNSSDLSMYILQEGLVSTVMGNAFGDDNCIRISYATSEDKIIEAFKRIKKVIEKLN